MANEPELKEIYSHIEATNGEMAAFRGRLEKRLPQRRGLRPLFWVPAAMAMAAALAFFLMLPRGEQVRFDGMSPDQLSALVASSADRDALRQQAWQAWQSDDEAVRRGAGVVLCLTLDTDQALQQAVAALTWEPRSQYRAFYLELIIDLSDGYRFDTERIEALMDNEVDQLCLYLYREWLRIA